MTDKWIQALDAEDLATIEAVARNEQSGRLTKYEINELVRVYRVAGELYELLRLSRDYVDDVASGDMWHRKDDVTFVKVPPNFARDDLTKIDLALAKALEPMTRSDIRDRKMSGDVCDNYGGNPVVWQGHICEGSNLAAPVGQEFCMWTLCGEHDVPAGKGVVGSLDDCYCSKCIEAWNRRVTP